MDPIFWIIVIGILLKNPIKDLPHLVRGTPPPSHVERMARMDQREATRNRRHQRRMARGSGPQGKARAYVAALKDHAFDRALTKRRIVWEKRDPVKAQRYADKIEARLAGTYRGPIRRTIDHGRALHQRAQAAVHDAQLDREAREKGWPDHQTRESWYRGVDEVAAKEAAHGVRPVVAATDTSAAAEPTPEGNAAAEAPATDGAQLMPWMCDQPSCRGRVHAVGTYPRTDGLVRVDGKCDTCQTYTQSVGEPKWNVPGLAFISGRDTSDLSDRPAGDTTSRPGTTTVIDGERCEVTRFADGEVGIYPDNLAAAAAEQRGWRCVSTPPPDGRRYYRNSDDSRLTVRERPDNTYEWTAAARGDQVASGTAAGLDDAFVNAEAAEHKNTATTPDTPITEPKGTTMTAGASEAIGVDEFSAALEQHRQAAEGGTPALEGLIASAQQQHVGPSVTDPLAQAQEVYATFVACIDQAQQGLQQSVNVGESYGANPDAGDATFVTNGARS